MVNGESTIGRSLHDITKENRSRLIEFAYGKNMAISQIYAESTRELEPHYMKRRSNRLITFSWKNELHLSSNTMEALVKKVRAKLRRRPNS